MLSGKHAHARELSASHEHYLRAIWEVRSERGYARLVDVARKLVVAPPTLSVGLRPLVAWGLVSHDDHRFLLLTPAGERPRSTSRPTGCRERSPSWADSRSPGSHRSRA